MYCIECGKQIQNHAKFCAFCGTPVLNHNSLDHSITVEYTNNDSLAVIQATKKGTLVYLQDILSMEFAISKLEHELQIANRPITIHDHWFFWKCFKLKPPYLTRYETYTKLYLSYSYKRKEFYYAFAEEHEHIGFYDHSGNSVNHKHGKPCCSSEKLDQITRDKLCTMPVFKKRLFSGTYIDNHDSLYFSPGSYYNNPLNLFAHIKDCIERFEAMVREQEQNYSAQLPTYMKTVKDIELEIANAKKIRDELYALNVIPKKFRNIGCAYFIHDFYASSNTPLSSVFLHLDLNTIQSQLETLIKTEQEAILQRAKIISQNEDMIAQNQRLFDELANMSKTVNGSLDSIRESSIETSQWAKVGALSAEASAWISAANYLG